MDEERLGDELDQPGLPELEDQPPIGDEVVDVTDDGLEGRPGRRKRVVVIGGGIAGLVAAFELKRQGHDPVLLAAQQRVGERVWTCRDFATLAYCREFGLGLHDAPAEA